MLDLFLANVAYEAVLTVGFAASALISFLYMITLEDYITSLVSDIKNKNFSGQCAVCGLANVTAVVWFCVMVI